MIPMIRRDQALDVSPDFVLRRTDLAYAAWSGIRRELVPIEPQFLHLFARFSGGRRVVEVLSELGASEPVASVPSEPSTYLPVPSPKEMHESKDPAKAMRADLMRAIVFLWDSGFLVDPVKLKSKIKVTSEDKTNHQKLPIFIGGSPRSGGTLLQHLVDAHPNLACASDIDFCSMYNLYDVLYTPGIAHRMELLGWDGPCFRSFLADELIGTTMQRYTRKRGKSRWAIKSPSQTKDFDLLNEIFDSKALFVFCVRHPFDVAESINSKVGQKMTFGMSDHRPTSNSFRLESHVDRWREMNDYVLSFSARFPKRSHIVRYEDLVNKPEAELRKLFTFLGESWDSSILETAFSQEPSPFPGDPNFRQTTRIEPSRTNRWHDWPIEVQKVLAPRVNSMLEAFGYDQITLS